MMTDEAHMPETDPSTNVLCYETLIGGEASDLRLAGPRRAHRLGALLHVGHHGRPQGRAVRHRSTLLHAYAGASRRTSCRCPAATACCRWCRCSTSTPGAFPTRPAWSAPSSCFPGPKMGDGEALYELMDSEDVTMALGVPTVWLGLLQYTESAGKRLDKLKRTLVGGAAVPRSMIEAFRDKHDVELRQGWGMTEMSPLGTLNRERPGSKT